MTRRWQKARTVVIAALAAHYFIASLFGSGGDVASAKAFALLALAMAWLALDRADEGENR